MAKLTVEQKRDLQLLQNSIERVINSTIKILNTDPAKVDQELIDINLQDWEELKPVVDHIWNEARTAAYIRANQKDPFIRKLELTDRIQKDVTALRELGSIVVFTVKHKDTTPNVAT